MKSSRDCAKPGRPKNEETPKTVFGKKLRFLQGMKKNSEFSEIMGVSSAALFRYIVGETKPDTTMLANLARETGVDLNWLLDDSQDIPEDKTPVKYNAAKAETIAISIPKPQNLTKAQDTVYSLLRDDITDYFAQIQDAVRDMRQIIDSPEEADKFLKDLRASRKNTRDKTA